MPAGPNDLVTLAQAYAWLGLTPGSDDTNLQFAISATSQLIADWCNRNFVQATYSECYDGLGGQRLTLREWPLISVASLSIDGIPVQANTLVPGGFVFDNRRTISLVNGYFTRGFQNVAVTYTAGYAPIPPDLQMACLEWMKAIYLQRQQNTNLVSERAGDHEMKFQAGGVVTQTGSGIAPMPASVFAVLSQYREVVPV